MGGQTYTLLEKVSGSSQHQQWSQIADLLFFFLIHLQTCPILNNSASYNVHQNCCLGPTQFKFWKIIFFGVGAMKQ
jgi:hypothetical protein